MLSEKYSLIEGEGEKDLLIDGEGEKDLLIEGEWEGDWHWLKWLIEYVLVFWFKLFEVEIVPVPVNLKVV